MGWQVGVEPEHHRRDDRAWHLSVTVEQLVDQLVAIDGVVDRLTQSVVLERRVRLAADREHMGIAAQDPSHLDAFLFHERCSHVYRNGEDDVHIACAQCCGPCCFLAKREVGDLVGLWRIAPVVRVHLHHRFLTPYPFHEPEGARPDGLCGEGFYVVGLGRQHATYGQIA